MSAGARLALHMAVDSVLSWQQEHPRTYSTSRWHPRNQPIAAALDAEAVCNELGIEAAAGAASACTAWHAAVLLLLLLRQLLASDKMSHCSLQSPPPCPSAGSSAFIKLLSWALAHISSRLPPKPRESAAAVLCPHGQEPRATCPGCMWLVPWSARSSPLH